MNKLVAKISLIIVAIIWGSGFVAAQLALDSGITPFYMMTFRFSIAAILLFIIFYRTLKNEVKSHLKPGVILGMFMFLAFAFQTVGLQYTTPAKNAFLTSTNVIIAPFLFWIIIRKKPDIYTFIGSVFVLVGIGFISIDPVNLSISIGDFYTLICAVLFACHIVYIGYYSQERNLNPITLVFLQMSTSSILSIICAISFESFVFDITIISVGSVFYLGLFSTLIAFLLQNTAQKYVVSTTAAIILSTEAVFGAFFSVLLLGEMLTASIIIGGTLVFIAIIITETKLSFLKRIGGN
ncbi:DMT family transporter [Mycoplasmatota bacterium WC44]